MEIKPVILVLADISGYTSFMRLHRTSLMHAELIITDLIESVLDSADHPLTVSKLEGDAVFFYAEIDGDPADVAHSVLNQLQEFFRTFHEREKEIVSCSACLCDACNRAGELRLKIMAHSGEALIKQVRNFEELAGEDVILVHRLLKNSVTADEYMLLTDAFMELVEAGPDWEQEPLTETYESLGDVGCTVYYPSGSAAREAAPDYEATLMDRVRHLLRFERYTLGRLLGLIRPREFSNLPE